MQQLLRGAGWRLQPVPPRVHSPV